MGKSRSSAKHSSSSKQKSLQKSAIEALFKKEKRVQAFEKLYTIEIRPYTEPNFDNAR